MRMAKAGLFAAEMEALGDLGHGLCTGVYWRPAFPFGSTAAGLSNAERGAQYEAAGRVDFTAGPVANCTTSGLAGGQWNRVQGARFPFQLDLVSNADFPEVHLTPDFRPLAFGSHGQGVGWAILPILPGHDRRCRR